MVKGLQKILLVGTILFSLGILSGCEKKSTPPKENIVIEVVTKIHFRNYDPRIYAAHVDGEPKGAISENSDPSNPYMYGMGMITVEDRFVNPGIMENRYHTLDVRSGETIHDTYGYLFGPGRNDSGTTYYHMTKCIKNSKFVSCD